MECNIWLFGNVILILIDMLQNVNIAIFHEFLFLKFIRLMENAIQMYFFQEYFLD